MVGWTLHVHPECSEGKSGSDSEITVAKTIVVAKLQEGLCRQFASLGLSSSICKVGLITVLPYEIAGGWVS